MAARTIIVFDTDCVLCSRWVHFILEYERDQEIEFVSAWSHKGQEIAASHGLSESDLQQTYLVLVNGRALTRSDAGFALLNHLRAPWRWLTLLRVIPRPLRDTVYAVIARNRYRWFGKSERCFVPPPGASSRFVDRDLPLR